MEGIALALFVCLILALVSRHFALPPIPFYILAGLALGRSGLALVTPGEVSGFFTDIGLIFLLFYVGLEMKPDRFIHRHGSFLIGGAIDFTVNMLLGLAAAILLGFGLFEAFVIAAAFYISSSAIVFASLIENRKLLLREADTIVWLMIFEDIVLIFILILLSSGVENPVFVFAKIAGLIVLFFAVAHFGKEVIVRILDRDDEIPVLLTFTVVLSTALFSRFIGIPETLAVIALGSALSLTSPDTFEQHARPFKDVFLVLFFVFFGISVEVAGLGIGAIVAFSLLAILSKGMSGLVIGKAVHGSTRSGIEILANTIPRGEFSIALAALYGSTMVSGTIAGMVIVTSIVGSFTARYSSSMIRIWRNLSHRSPHRAL